jgi:glyoxylate reductase
VPLVTIISASPRPPGDAFTLAGKWKTWGLTQLLGQDVTGATLGIIGFGRIGRGMAKRAQGFDMHVLYFDPATQDDPYAAEIGAQRADLDSLLRQADFISVHTPLTEATYHLIGTKALAKMKPTAILINTARGPIVDPDALYRALKDGVICYAALDVTEPEPIPMDHPLLTLPNLIITPHIASASVKTRGKMIQMSIDNLLAGLRGEHLPNCVNPEVYISGAS